ncbi:MAG: asparagine synthase B [Clostridia bacterium]|nr:asparagine synthase B [Clostridia bacterium]
MCSITGYCGKTYDRQKFEKAFWRTKSRGPDDTRIVDTGDGLLGFHRLSIMGLHPEGMQPFILGKHICVCNGEIYGFREMKKKLQEKYTFESDSDCEILIPLYIEHGIDFFRMLDAEFALILYDGEKDEYIAGRDPLGIRPLYYGYDDAGTIVFASEPKSLMGLVGRILPFPPGHYYKDGKFICFCDISKPAGRVFGDIDTVCRGIKERLIKGVEKRLDADAKIGFLLSGGLDSSLVCSIAARILGHPIETFAIGMSEDAIDLKYAREVAEYIGSSHHEIYMTPEDVKNNLRRVIELLGTFDITTIRASMGMYLLCKGIHETSDVRVLLTGEVSDELFGYKYTDFAPDAAAFQQEAEKRIHEIHMYDVLRADRCISVNSLEARVPFGDLEFVRYVMSIDPELKLNKYNKGKYLLRHAFDDGTYLPDNILMREKAAFSDAVGHSMVDYLKETAEEAYTDSKFRELSGNYKHAAPFTKESLLYREIFEEFYPGQAEMVKDFWMPNKSWEGCDVNDPSARVLKNYGNSGT